jgi:hypothetical protein
MDEPASLANSTVMENLSFSKPSLTTLPTELIDKIFSFIDNLGLINLRLVSRSVCAIANRPFAVENFANSHHVVTRHSFDTLLAVSAHDIFVRSSIVLIRRIPMKMLWWMTYSFKLADSAT